jgi:hypothetical protein
LKDKFQGEIKAIEASCKILGKREEGRGKREEGRGKREEGRGKMKWNVECKNIIRWKIYRVRISNSG